MQRPPSLPYFFRHTSEAIVSLASSSRYLRSSFDISTVSILLSGRLLAGRRDGRDVGVAHGLVELRQVLVQNSLELRLDPRELALEHLEVSVRRIRWRGVRRGHDTGDAHELVVEGRREVQDILVRLDV